MGTRGDGRDLALLYIYSNGIILGVLAPERGTSFSIIIPGNTSSPRYLRLSSSKTIYISLFHPVQGDDEQVMTFNIFFKIHR